MNARLEKLESLVADWVAPEELAFYQAIAQELYGKATPDFLRLLDEESAVAIMCNAVGLLENKKSHDVRVRVSNPCRRTHGWGSGYTVIEATVSDRPFLVDSISNELRRLGLELRHVVHPIFELGRDERGFLVRKSNPLGACREAYQLFLVRRQPETSLPAIEAAIARVMANVKAVTDDYLQMRRNVGNVCAELLAMAPRATPRHALELRESMQLLEWLDDKNFVFLAYRYAERIETAEGARLRSVPGRDLGLIEDLTRDSNDNPVPLCNPPDLMELRLSSYPPLVVRTSPESSTVHRSGRMTSIVIKQLDGRFKVVGEHTFLGHLTSKAAVTPVSQVPILRQSLQQVLELDGALRDSHAYEQIVGLINSQPKEALFWSRPHDLLRDVRAIMAMRFANEVRVTVRSEPTGEEALVTVLLPQECYNSALREVLRYTLMETFRAASVELRVSLGEAFEPVRFHCSLYSPGSLSEVDLKALEARLLRLTRTWRDYYYRPGRAVVSAPMQPRHSLPRPTEAAIARRAVNW